MQSSRLRILCVLPLAVAFQWACEAPGSRTAAPPVCPAAVAAPDSFSARVASDILAAGGNAVDASVAAAFVLAVTLPEAGNIGGGGFMTVHMDGRQAFLDYRESAPAAATPDMYLDSQGEVIADSSLVGARAAGTPGTVAGLWAAHQRFGSKSWPDLLAPAIRLARQGFVVPEPLAERVDRFARKLAGRTNFAEYFGDMAPGSRFHQPELADTLERIANAGVGDFYHGTTAALLVAQMERAGGLLTAEDLAAYEPLWREPLRGTWRQFTIITAPLPSSGGIALLQLLGMRDRLHSEFSGLQHNSAQYVHLIAEMEKRVFADRAEYLGDPDFISDPTPALIADSYIARRAAEVQPEVISTLEGVAPGLESVETTHFSIVDSAGNAVANTYTLNGGFGSGLVVKGAGFLLNNEMDDFAIKTGAPNLYGVVGSDANAVAPNKRMLSSMTPTILLRDGRVDTVIGTPGGPTIFTSVFQALVNMVDFSMTPQEAVDAARFHHQLLPPEEVVYSRCCPLPETTIQELTRRGYSVVPHSSDLGDLQVVRIDSRTGWSTGSDRRGRGEGKVVGFSP